MSTIAQDAAAPRRALSRIHRARGETREIVLEHAETGGRIAARLVRVEGGGVDRTTGQPLKVYFELTVKLPGKIETRRTFAGQGDPLAAEWNARLAYLMAQHGVVDFSTPVGDLPPRLWPEPKNLTALARCAEGWVASRTRMNSGDSHADCAAGGQAAPLPRPARSKALSALPWWAGSDEPVWAPPRPRRAPLFRDSLMHRLAKGLEELRTKEVAVPSHEPDAGPGLLIGSRR